MSVPLPRTADFDEPGDAELIAAVRAGGTEAYGLLYRRHSGSALALARHLTGSWPEADDLVAESFAKVLDVLRGGGGPDAAFRAYLLTTVRHTLYDRVRRDRRLELSDDMTRHDPGVPWEDTAVAGLESALAARAFTKLPERWQTVLWHTEVEQESPAEVAPLLGLTPNGVAALAYRAREGLRQAYLQEHLADGVAGAHLATVNRLGAWARGGLSARQRAKVDAHLAGCDTCSALAAELAQVSGGLGRESRRSGPAAGRARPAGQACSAGFHSSARSA
jgi:RNA polymerase sigma factor (sigma-70 family)